MSDDLGTEVSPKTPRISMDNRTAESHAPGVSGDAQLAEGPAAPEALPGILGRLQVILQSIDQRLDQLERQPRSPSTAAGSAKARRTSPWALPASQAWFFVLALAAAATILFLRLFRLDQLQAELYGDIAIVYEYVSEIRARRWPTHFILSAGPLYHYVITPIIMLTGPTYFGFKLASVGVSLGVLAATYALSRRLLDDYFAVLAGFVAGISSWLLIFSRLGNSQIIVPLLATCALWLAVRFAQNGHQADLVICAVVSALGLYAYPQSFVLPLVVWLTLLSLRWMAHPITWADLRLFILITVLSAIPFTWIVLGDPGNFFSGYIGGKLQSSGSLAETLLGNITRALFALHIRGDAVFRSNPDRLPHLDWISGLLFLAGVIFWLQPERRRWSAVLFVPLLLLQVPSALVLRYPDEVPSASRSLAIAPIAYILVASGLWWLARGIWTRSGKQRALAVTGVLLGALLLVNTQRYFQTYINGLPYHNTPMGRIIATYLDSLPPDTQIYLVGCCWEEYGMPEPRSIQYVMKRPQNLHLVEVDELSCGRLQALPTPSVLVWSFHDPLPGSQLGPCQLWLPAQLHSSVEGLPVFYAAPLRRDLAGTSAIGQLESSQAVLDRQGQPGTWK